MAGLWRRSRKRPRSWRSEEGLPDQLGGGPGIDTPGQADGLHGRQQSPGCVLYAGPLSPLSLLRPQGHSMGDEAYLNQEKDNLRWWNGAVDAHVKSDYYPLADFLAGKSSLMPLEKKALGNVRGKKLLHLQCHFGMDTLSW